MNKDLMSAYENIMQAKKFIERANNVLWLDNTLDEIEKLEQCLIDDIGLEERRLNVRVTKLREVV